MCVMHVYCLMLNFFLIVINLKKKFYQLHYIYPVHAISMNNDWSINFPIHWQEDMGMTYDELSLYGRLRKQNCCGPYSMFCKLVHVWKDQFSPEEVSIERVRGMLFYKINPTFKIRQFHIILLNKNIKFSYIF